jgi:hypothetical protein
MKIVTLRVDLYSRIILTIIAIALILIALRPLLPNEVRAMPQTVDVNIESIGGLPVLTSTLNVEVTNPDEIGYWTNYYLRQ